MSRFSFTVLAVLALVAGCESSGDSVGPRGGTIVSEDGRFSLEIRPGALEQDVDIAIHEVGCGSMGVDAVGPCYRVTPAGMGFLYPATVTFELEGDSHDGVPADDLGLIIAHGKEWTVLADRVIDVEDGTISASAVYLSSFAVAQMR